MKIKPCKSEKPDSKSIKLQRQAKQEEKITKRKILLSNALKIPPAINQFNTTVTDDDFEKLFSFLKKYSPETRKEKINRLKKENPQEGPKPVLLKFGLNHVVSLIEQKKAKFVVIAADVDPIDMVIYIPTLCKKMNIPYVIVKSKEVLGGLVHLKKTACVCLCDFRKEDSREWNEMIGIGKEMFLERYEAQMSAWGGGILLSKGEENPVN